MSTEGNRKTPEKVKRGATLIVLTTAISVFLIYVLPGIFGLGFEVLQKSSYGSSHTSYEELQNSFAIIRNNLVIIIGAIGVPFLVWRTWLAAQQTKTAEKQAEAALMQAEAATMQARIARKNTEVARENAILQLLNSSVEQLGAQKVQKTPFISEEQKQLFDTAGQPLYHEIYVPNIEVRNGAIYALERIMHESEKDAPAIVDTLAAYVRENCGEPKPFECEIPKKGDFATLGYWYDAIKNEVGDADEPADNTIIARSHVLRKNAPADRVDIKTALTVIGRRPDSLNGKDTKKPDLRNVNFQGANLSNFDLDWMNFTGAKMQGAIFSEAGMQGVNLFNAKMQGAVLLGAKMQGADLSRAEMQGADLSHATMQGANLFNAKMQGANLFGAAMQGAKLRGAEMQGAFLTFAEMQGIDLRGAEMQGADLSDAEMQGADLRGAEMQGADLRSADFAEVQITEAQKTAASVIWLDFTKAVFDPEELQTQLEDMFGHKEHTKLPDGMDPPTHWSKADMKTKEGREQYNREWEAFKKKMGVE
ncbi:MAG: pentapeptide repeat-containing protein [Pseudomonadota bacterium]